MRPDPAMTAAMEAGDWSAYAEAAYEMGRREGLEGLRLDDKGGTDALTVVQRGLRRVQELRDAYPSEDAYLHGTISILGSECLNDDIEGLEWLADAIRALAAPHTPEARIADPMREAIRLLRRYRTETPLGHQPHMIAHEADALLAQPEARIAEDKP